MSEDLVVPALLENATRRGAVDGDATLARGIREHAGMRSASTDEMIAKARELFAADGLEGDALDKAVNSVAVKLRSVEQ